MIDRCAQRFPVACAAALVLLMVHLPTPTAASQPAAAASSTITLTEAVDRALARNHSLAAKEHALSAAAWTQRQARAQLLPSISLESSYTRLDDETVRRANPFGRSFVIFLPDSNNQCQPTTMEIPQTVFRDGYQTSIRGQMLLLSPAVWNAASLASTGRDVAAWDLEVGRQATAHQTLSTFLELLRIRSLVGIQQRHLEQARQNLEQAERLYQVGRYAEADVLRWRVEEARQSGIYLQQQSAQRVAALTLENLIGDPPRGLIAPDTLLPGPLAREIARFRVMDEVAWDAFMARPLEQEIAGNPQLRVLDRSLRLAELEHRQSLIGFLPNVTVAGSYGWQNNDTVALDGEKAWSVSAILSLPLFTSGANYSQRQTTKWRVSQTREEIAAARRGLLLAAEAGRTSIRSFAEQLRLAEVSLVSARRSYEMRRNSFDLGRLTNLEWIDAQLALLEAEQVFTSAYYDLVLAIADYHQAGGRILDLLEEARP